jgi:hypothetical protein
MSFAFYAVHAPSSDNLSTAHPDKYVVVDLLQEAAPEEEDV